MICDAMALPVMQAAMGGLFWLNDEQCSTIEPHLPQSQPGIPRVDDRRVILGILHVLKSGCRWSDCPQPYDPSATVYSRLNHCSNRRFWTGLLKALASAGALTRSTVVDCTYVRAQRAAFGGKEGAKRRRSAPRAVGRQPKPTPSPT